MNELEQAISTVCRDWISEDPLFFGVYFVDGDVIVKQAPHPLALQLVTHEEQLAQAKRQAKKHAEFRIQQAERALLRKRDALGSKAKLNPFPVPPHV